MRKPKDKDFIETSERLIFCVIGYLHPPDAYTAYLKYRPDPTGKWVGKGVRYHRMMRMYSAAEMQTSNEWLHQHYPEYIAYCPVRGVDLPLIPRSRVAKYYIPEYRLTEVLNNPQDSLEEKTAYLITHLAEHSGVPVSDFGVTGSILLGTHNPEFSDINIIVSGDASAKTIRNAVGSIYEEARLQRFNNQEIAKWRHERAQLLGIPTIYAEQMVWAHWIRGRIDGTPFHLHPTRKDAEIVGEYGSESFTALGPIEFTATISEDHESLFVPAQYGIKDLTFIKGPPKAPPVTRIVSFEGIFAGCVNKGDRVRVYGTLEAVKNHRERIIRYQVVIGTYSSQGWLVEV